MEVWIYPRLSESGPPQDCPESRHLMDVEHLNSIGTAIADLTRRTAELRGYL